LIENVNEGFTVLTGYGRDEAIGKTANELGLWENIEDRNDIIKELNEKGYSENKDILFCKKNGEFYYGNFSASLIYLKGIPHIISTNRDMTDDRARQKEIENLSYHDYLTGIYNRRYYEKAAGNVDRKSNLPISIILIDVNDLKYINDKYGHEVGDKALQRTALAIKSACREDDIVARWGGDEFVVLLQRTDDDKLEKIISRIKENILNEKNGVVDISVSLGYKTKTDMGESINSVFIDAEKQMYSNKVVFKSKRK
jgi:diguanylate cyclase (GGDEF)-like protein/PAS domain S-box-containing protein